MATVYLAEHPRINKKVAIKVIQPELATNREMVSRFLAEARAASQINHEHVVDILDFGQTPAGDNFMIMEYLDGKTLSARVKELGRIDVPRTLHIAIQIAEALVSAHQRGVIHRDLKPTNLFLPGGDIDRVQILDFGIARRLAASRAMTRTGVVVGTPEYMAPEQARGDRHVGPSADIFSLGCVTFECLTGQPPFVSEHIAAVLAKILFEEAPSLKITMPEVPDPLCQLVARMLARKRAASASACGFSASRAEKPSMARSSSAASFGVVIAGSLALGDSVAEIF